MARNDPFEADLHGLEPEKLVRSCAISMSGV